MQISAILNFLETVAPAALQESYDNVGLITGSDQWQCSGVLVTLDATEEVIDDAIKNNCNLVVAHHPIIFSGLKKVTGKNYVEKTVIKAIKNDVAIFAIHTNLDNIAGGVNGKIASLLELSGTKVLSGKTNALKKIFTFVPTSHTDSVRNAIFKAGGGNIGKYSECSFNMEGAGTFKPGAGTHPYVGEIGKQQRENETKIEVIFPSWMESHIVKAMMASHPYEEVAFDIIPVDNVHQAIGSGLVGELEEPMSEPGFMSRLKSIFQLKVIRHSSLLDKPIKKVAVCGGAGSFLISKAIAIGADALVTADFKYHEFFDANGSIVLFDVGHFESEQFTTDLLYDLLTQKFPNFAVLKTGVRTNPINYYF
jgi:dinuclear metal center YbgI/SA1388 family protein